MADMDIDDTAPVKPGAICCSQLERIISMSREMLDCARRDEWQRLIEIESERTHLLYEFFQTDITAYDSDGLSTSIRMIQKLDKETMQYIQAEYESVSDELKKLNKGRRVSSAYLP